MWSVIFPASSWSVNNHIATQATGFLIGTHASINAKHDEQTDPIDVDHPELKHSETALTEYGNSNDVGITGIKAFSANAP